MRGIVLNRKEEQRVKFIIFWNSHFFKPHTLERLSTHSQWLEGCVCYTFSGRSHPPFWRVFLFFLRCLFGFRGVVCNPFRVQQIFNLASQHLCYPPELVNVRAFPMPCTPALYWAIAQTSPAAKLSAADPGGLAALGDGVSCMFFSLGAALLFYTVYCGRGKNGRAKFTIQTR